MSPAPPLPFVNTRSLQFQYLMQQYVEQETCNVEQENRQCVDAVLLPRRGVHSTAADARLLFAVHSG